MRYISKIYFIFSLRVQGKQSRRSSEVVKPCDSRVGVVKICLILMVFSWEFCVRCNSNLQQQDFSIIPSRFQILSITSSRFQSLDSLDSQKVCVCLFESLFTKSMTPVLWQIRTSSRKFAKSNYGPLLAITLSMIGVTCRLSYHRAEEHSP